MPWNDFPLPQMPDLSELVMRWLGDWPDDNDEPVSLTKKNKTGRRKKAAGNSEAHRRPEPFAGQPQRASVRSPACVVANNDADNGPRPSTSRRKIRNKRKRK